MSKSESIKNIDIVPESIKLAHELEKTDDVELVKADLNRLLELLPQELNLEINNDVNSVYAGMKSENCLVRVETLSRVLETIELKTPLEISSDTESHYANAVIPEQEGLKLAFAEGQAPGPIRTMVAFGKTIIGFKTDHISVSEIDFSETDIRNVKERKYLCRHVVGDLEPEDIRFLVMRIPYKLILEKNLTEEEKTAGSPFVFRCIKF